MWNCVWSILFKFIVSPLYSTLGCILPPPLARVCVYVFVWYNLSSDFCYIIDLCYGKNFWSAYNALWTHTHTTTTSIWFFFSFRPRGAFSLPSTPPRRAFLSPNPSTPLLAATHATILTRAWLAFSIPLYWDDNKVASSFIFSLLLFTVPLDWVYWTLVEYYVLWIFSNPWPVRWYLPKAGVSSFSRVWNREAFLHQGQCQLRHFLPNLI